MLSPSPDRPAALLALFGRHGFATLDTPILQPAGLFLELSGEDIRRRLFLTQEADGTEHCLRPEHTIPVCRHHLASGRAAGLYGYCGPVFRQRAGEPGEFLQAGIESIGAPDALDADAAILALALEGVALWPVRDLRVRAGDMDLIEAVAAALGLPPSLQRRLVRRLAAGGAIADLLAPPRPAGSDYAGLLAAIEGQDPKAARAFVEDVISIAGIATVGGRTAAEIAERFLSRAANREGAGERATAVLERYLAIEEPLPRASATLPRGSRRAPSRSSG
jgi:ATP phosphoribosyltransferase regulatory subunit